MTLQDRLADELRNLVADDAHVNAGLIIEHLGLREPIRVPHAYTTPEGAEFVDQVALRMHAEWGIGASPEEQKSARDVVLEVLGAVETVAGGGFVSEAKLSRLRFADSELTKLEDWIADNLPRVVLKPEVTTVDFVIGLLGATKGAMPLITKVIVEQIWKPMVTQMRALGFEVPEVEVKKS
jgi:hypothetical protein